MSIWLNDHRASTVEIHTDTEVGGAEAISGITASSIAANSVVKFEPSSGSLYATVAYLENVSPVGSFTTLNLKRAIEVIGLTAKCITNDTNPGIHQYFQLQGCEGPEAGAVHRRYTTGKGVLYPRSLSVDHRGDAEMVYELATVYDGQNDPVAVTENVALPAVTDDDDRYTMSQFDIAGITFDTDHAADPQYDSETEVIGKRSINIDFQPTVSSAGADSELYDSVQSITSVLPLITVTGVDIKWFKTVAEAIGRDKSTAADITFYMSRRNSLPAALEHIRFQTQGFISWDSIVSGTPTEASTASFQISCISEGGNIPIIGTVDVALP